MKKETLKYNRVKYIFYKDIMKTFREYYHETNLPKKALRNKKSVILDKQTFDEGFFTSGLGNDYKTGSVWQNMTNAWDNMSTGRRVMTVATAGSAVAAGFALAGTAPAWLTGIAAARGVMALGRRGASVIGSLMNQRVSQCELEQTHGVWAMMPPHSDLMNAHEDAPVPRLIYPDMEPLTWDANTERFFPRGMMESINRSGAFTGDMWSIINGIGAVSMHPDHLGQMAEDVGNWIGLPKGGDIGDFSFFQSPPAEGPVRAIGTGKSVADSSKAGVNIGKNTAGDVNPTGLKTGANSGLDAAKTKQEVLKQTVDKLRDQDMAEFPGQTGTTNVDMGNDYPGLRTPETAGVAGTNVGQTGNSVAVGPGNQGVAGAASGNLNQDPGKLVEALNQVSNAKPDETIATWIPNPQGAANPVDNFTALTTKLNEVGATPEQLKQIQTMISEVGKTASNPDDFVKQILQTASETLGPEKASGLNTSILEGVKNQFIISEQGVASSVLKTSAEKASAVINATRTATNQSIEHSVRFAISYSETIAFDARLNYSEAGESGFGNFFEYISGTDAGYGAAKRENLLSIVSKALITMLDGGMQRAGGDTKVPIGFLDGAGRLLDPKDSKNRAAIVAVLNRVIQRKITREITEGDDLKAMYDKLMIKCGFVKDTQNAYKPFSGDEAIKTCYDRKVVMLKKGIDILAKKAEQQGKTVPEVVEERETLSRNIAKQSDNIAELTVAANDRRFELMDELASALRSHPVTQQAAKASFERANLPTDSLDKLMGELSEIKSILKQTLEVNKKTLEAQLQKPAPPPPKNPKPPEEPAATETAPEEEDGTTAEPKGDKADKPAGKKIRSRLNSAEFKKGGRAKIPTGLKTGLKNIGKYLVANPKTLKLLRDIGLTSNTVTVGLTDDGGVFFTEEFEINISEVGGPEDIINNPDQAQKAQKMNTAQAEQKPGTTPTPATQKAPIAPAPAAPKAPIAKPAADDKNQLMAGANYGAVTNTKVTLDRSPDVKRKITQNKQFFNTIKKIIEKLITKQLMSNPKLKQEIQRIKLGTIDANGKFSLNGRYVLYMSPGKFRKKLGEGENPKSPKKYLVFEDIFNESNDIEFFVETVD